MRTSFLRIAVCLFVVSSIFINVQYSYAFTKNGTIVSKVSGFPYETYDQWLQECKSRYSFNEKEFKKKYPPGDFETYKEKINCPFETYEEWIQVLRNRFNRSKFDEMTFIKKYPREDFDKFKGNIEYLKIKYMSDGLKIAGYILKPKNYHEKKLPVVIYNRGGNQDIGILDFEKLYSFFDLVSKGYVLVASQYRGCSESEGHDELGGKDVNDVLNLIPLIGSLSFADSSRIGMYGWSRGGMMTYLVLKKTDEISAAVIGAGPTDFISNLEKRPEAEELLSKLIPNYLKDREKELKSRSAVYWPDKLYRGTPILLLQGSEDKQTHPPDVLRMVSKLYEINHPVRFVLFENGDHGLSQYSKEVNNLVNDWFNRYLKDNKP